MELMENMELLLWDGLPTHPSPQHTSVEDDLPINSPSSSLQQSPLSPTLYNYNNNLKDLDFVQKTDNTDDDIDWYEESVNLELFTSDPLSDLSRPYTPTSQEFLNQLIDDNSELTEDFNDQFASILSSIPVTLDDDFLFSSAVSMDAEDADGNLSEQIIDSLLIGDLQSAQNSINQDQEVKAVITKSQAKPRISKSQKAKKKKATKLEKSLRKKEQNKTAATRYREKKKLLAAVVMSEESELSLINEQLKTEKKDLQKEINIVKSLLLSILNNSKKYKNKK